MIVRFTNAAEQHRGNPIYINPDYVAAVYETARTPGGSLMTVLYGGPTGVEWQVEESLHEAVKLLNNEDKKA